MKSKFAGPMSSVQLLGSIFFKLREVFRDSIGSPAIVGFCSKTVLVGAGKTVAGIEFACVPEGLAAGARVIVAESHETVCV